MLSLLLTVPSCIYSFWHGVIPSFLMYTCFINFYAGLALTVARGEMIFHVRSIVHATRKEKRAASQLISAPLVERIINQDHWLNGCHSVQQSIKRRIQHTKHTKQKEDAKNLLHNRPTPFQHSMELSQEKGASTWLTALPIDEHGFTMHKAAFRDSLALRYG